MEKYPASSSNEESQKEKTKVIIISSEDRFHVAFPKSFSLTLQLTNDDDFSTLYK